MVSPARLGADQRGGDPGGNRELPAWIVVPSAGVRRAFDGRRITLHDERGTAPRALRTRGSFRRRSRSRPTCTTVLPDDDDGDEHLGVARRAAAGAGRRCIRGGAQGPYRVEFSQRLHDKLQSQAPSAELVPSRATCRHVAHERTNGSLVLDPPGDREHVHWSQDRSRARPRCRAPCAVRSVCPGVTNTSWPSKRTTIRPALSSRCSRALSVRWRSTCRCPLPSYSMARPASASRRSGRPRCSPVRRRTPAR